MAAPMKHERFERDIPLLNISIPKATPDELQRGVDAAVAVFQRAGVSPVETAND